MNLLNYQGYIFSYSYRDIKNSQVIGIINVLDREVLLYICMHVHNCGLLHILQYTNDICDLILENQPNGHNWHFKKYRSCFKY